MARRSKRRAPRAQRGVEFWRDADQRQRASGRSIAAFCAGEGLACSTFSYWRRKLAHLGVSPSAAPTLVPVEVVPDSPTSMAGAPLELVLRTGHVVRVPPGFDEGSLARLVWVLESQPC